MERNDGHDQQHHDQEPDPNAGVQPFDPAAGVESFDPAEGVSDTRSDAANQELGEQLGRELQRPTSEQLEDASARARAEREKAIGTVDERTDATLALVERVRELLERAAEANELAEIIDALHGESPADVGLLVIGRRSHAGVR